MSKVQTQSEWEWQAANDIFKFIKMSFIWNFDFLMWLFVHLFLKLTRQLIQCQLMAILFILSRSI